MVRRGNDSDRCRDSMVMGQVVGRRSDMTAGRHGDGLQDEREDGRNHVMVKLQCMLCYSVSERRKHFNIFTSTSTSSHTSAFVLHANIQYGLTSGSDASTTSRGLSVVDHYTVDQSEGGCVQPQEVMKAHHSNNSSGLGHQCMPNVKHPSNKTGFD